MDGRLPEVNAATVLEQARGVAWVTAGDEVVVYRVASGASLVLNATGGLLWQCLDGSSPLGDIFDDLAVAFRADRAAVEQDCIPILNRWLSEQLVERVRSG